MIKKVIKFIKIRYREIIIVSIIFICIIGLSSSIFYEKNGKANKVIMDMFLDITESTIDDNLKDKVYTDEKDKKILKLEEENANLRKDIIKFKSREYKFKNLENLKGALNFIDDKYDPIPISATVIAKNDGKFFKTFTVTAGSNDGVKVDSIAINEKGLIGRVYEVSNNYSKVISIMDNKANVSFEIVEKPDQRGVLNQEIDISYDESYMDNMVNGYLFNINAQIKKGDTIVTSGMGLYPESIPIGKVSNIVDDKQNLVKFVQIEPFVNFENINILTLLNPRETE